MTTNRETTGAQGAERQGNQAKLDAVEASDLEAAPASQTGAQGDSYYNPALTGSGTILPDGTYGAPIPDPNLGKRQELTTEAKEEDGTTGPVVTDSGAETRSTSSTKRTRTTGSN